jgi:plasmid maintenance system antidote protein VapI
MTKSMKLRSRGMLRQRLDALDISEREVARSASLGHATVNHLVTGRRQTCNDSTARAIARVLRVDVHALFDPVP